MKSSEQILVNHITKMVLTRSMKTSLTLDVNVDFDESSRCWMENKIALGNGEFSYKPWTKSNGSQCAKTSDNTHDMFGYQELNSPSPRSLPCSHNTKNGTPCKRRVLSNHLYFSEKGNIICAQHARSYE